MRPSIRSSCLTAWLFLLPLSVAAAPTQASLIAAWEQVQRSDPETIAFEKRADGSYRFATKRFPFDGELKLLKATIDDRSGGDQFFSGIVEVELVGLPEKIRQDYAHSYAIWAAGNMLYYDVAAKRWLTPRQFQEAARARLPGSFFWGSLWSWGPALLFILLLLFLARMLGRAQRKQKEYMGRIERSFEISERTLALSERNSELVDRSLRLTEESNRVLKEILEVLRRAGPG